MFSIPKWLQLFIFFVTISKLVAASELDKRQCVVCPSTAPACPQCNNGELCSFTSQSCTQCAQAVCISASQVNNLSGISNQSPSGPNTGAIAGGIVGALVVVACIAGGIFWHIRKKKRATRDMDTWLDKAKPPMEDEEINAVVSGQPPQSPSIHGSSASAHHSIASTTMSHASNVIPIGYIPSPLRNTFMSTETGHESMSTLASPRSHPPTQFFSADDILRNSVATNNRDTQYRDTMYSDRTSIRDTRYSNRDSTATDYTRASIATRASMATTTYRSTAIIAPAPVPVNVRAAAPKLVTIGKRSPAQNSPIPAVPTLTAEKVAEAERLRASAIAGHDRTSNPGLGMNIPIAIQPSVPRLSTISSVPTSAVRSEFGSPQLEPPMPESPVLPETSEELPPSTRGSEFTDAPSSPIVPPADEEETLPIRNSRLE